MNGGKVIPGSARASERISAPRDEQEVQIDEPGPRCSMHAGRNRAGRGSGQPPLPPEALREFGEAFTTDADGRSRLGGNRLTHMDAAGVDMQVVSHGNGTPSTLARPEAVELCRRVNDDLAAQIAEHPDRFRGFATLPLFDPPAAADELRRCTSELGFVGALTFGTFQGLFLDDARFEPVLAAAEEVDLPIYVHPRCRARRCRTRTTPGIGRFRRR